MRQAKLLRGTSRLLVLVVVNSVSGCVHCILYINTVYVALASS